MGKKDLKRLPAARPWETQRNPHVQLRPTAIYTDSVVSGYPEDNRCVGVRENQVACRGLSPCFVVACDQSSVNSADHRGCDWFLPGEET